MTTVRVHSKKKYPCQRSLSPTRLVNTSRFWLTGTDTATRTVVAGHGNSEHRLLGTFELEALGRSVLEAFRGTSHGGFVNDLHADGCMRADCGDRSASPHSRLRRLVMTSRLRLTAHLPHCTQASGFQLGMLRARSRFSYLVVAVGNTPSQGILETGRSSPLPLMISAVTSFTNFGASP